MIAHVRGQVVSRHADRVVVDVHGVGYLVHVAGLEAVPPRGQPVELHTSLQVREDAMDLYGFPDRDSLELFELLMGASGVGPKLALATLRTHSPRTLRQAIAAGDLATLSAVPGIGKKSAQRIVLELKDKVGISADDVVDLSSAGGGTSSVRGEVREALLALGYSTGEVQEVVTGLEVDGHDVAELVREALRTLGGASRVRT